MSQPMEHARQVAERESGDPQGRNAAWWNELPMTYLSWDKAERTNLASDDFFALEDDFLGSTPWFSSRPDLFRDRSGQAVLEIGCGAGAASCLFTKAGAEVTAVDLTEGAVELTAANAKAQGLQIDVRKMDAEHLEFPEASFDYVFAWGVLHHSADPVAAYQDVARVLRPGGQCVTMVYNRASFRYWIRGLEWLLLKGKRREGYTMKSVQQFYTDGYFHRHFTRREIEEIHRRVGLSPECVSVTHMAKRMAPKVLVRADQWLKDRAGWLLVVEANKP